MNQFNHDIESTIQRYVRNELPSDEVELFEDYFVDKPTILEKIETARNMLDGLNSSSEQLLLDSINQASSVASPIQRFFEWLTIPTPAYASALACLGTALIFSSFQTPVPNHPTLIGFSTEQTRNAGDAVFIDLSAQEPYRSVFIKLPKVEYRSYLLSISEPESGELLWQSTSFSFSALGDRMVFLPDELVLSKAKIELLAERPNKAPVAVRFCHYSERCE